MRDKIKVLPKSEGSQRSVCHAHSPRAIVIYQGPKCPFCDELERIALRKAQERSTSYKDTCWKPKPKVNYG